MNRAELLNRIRLKGSFLCVGLDPDPLRIPVHLRGEEDGGIYAFNCAIIDATRDYCVAYKPNLAFYESMGVLGMRSLERTVEYIRSTCPDQFIIADAKRGDIGNTSELYARYFFDYLRSDAVTVAPYMGSDSVRPFLREGRWVILLALTSNVGSEDFQLMPDASGVCLFERVIEVSQGWATPDQLMYVVGATQPELLRKIRRLAPDHFFLVPGVGAQGGSLELVCRYGINAQCGLLVNASRSIIYASSGIDFAEAATCEARTMRDEMFSYLREYKII